MLPAFGYDYVPGILAGAIAVRERPEATRVDIGYSTTGSLRDGLSQGTRATIAADGRNLGTVHLEGPSIYSLTGELLATAATDLARAAVRQAGVLDPLDAYDLNTLEARCIDVGPHRTPR